MLLFFQKAVAESQTAVPLALAGYTSETVHHAQEPDAYKRLELVLTDALTAGSISVVVYKNASPVADATCYLYTSGHRASVAIEVSVASGDRIELKVTTASGLTPTDADLLALLY